MNNFKWFRTISIRDKLHIIIFLIVSLIGIFMVLYFPSRFHDKTFAALEEKAISIADMLAFNISPGLEFGDVEMVYEAIEGAKINKDLDYIIVYDIEQKQFASYNCYSGMNPSIYFKLEDRETKVLIDNDRLNVSTSIISHNGVVGTLVLGLSLKDIQSQLAEERKLTLLLSALIILIGYFVATFLAYRLTKPIKVLEGAATQLSEGKTGIEIEVKSNDEIGSLAHSFNEMSRNLHQARLELEEYNQTLGRMVQKRTAELMSKTSELEERNIELVQANKAKSEFLATTSHELRTPLNSIIGFTKLILDDMCGTRDEEKGLLKDVHNSALHLLEVINSILDLSKIEAGKMVVSLEEVDPQPILEEILVSMDAEAKKKELDLFCIHEPEKLPTVHADPVKFRQVLLNLVANALKFTNEGSITLRVSAKEERSHIWFSVEDTGVGIPPEMQDKVFHVFTQVDSSFSRRHEGTGLGLTLTKRLIELMGGQISLESEGENKGTKVFFTLPIFRSESCDEEIDEERIEELSSCSSDETLVLIVENDAKLLKYMRSVLSNHGCAVITASTADLAIQMLHEQHPKVILLDIGMPGLENAVPRDGLDVLRELDQCELIDRIGILIITGHDEEWIEKRLEQEKVHIRPEILRKPISAELILDKLGRFIDGVGNKSVQDVRSHWKEKKVR
jgi:signal transduction histidine kinase/FixJ family two-component response regulator